MTPDFYVCPWSVSSGRRKDTLPVRALEWTGRLGCASGISGRPFRHTVGETSFASQTVPKVRPPANLR